MQGQFTEDCWYDGRIQCLEKLGEDGLNGDRGRQSWAAGLQTSPTRGNKRSRTLELKWEMERAPKTEREKNFKCCQVNEKGVILLKPIQELVYIYLVKAKQHIGFWFTNKFSFGIPHCCITVLPKKDHSSAFLRATSCKPQHFFFKVRVGVQYPHTLNLAKTTGLIRCLNMLFQ